jgi:hypothetical protein
LAGLPGFLMLAGNGKDLGWLRVSLRPQPTLVVALRL